MRQAQPRRVVLQVAQQEHVDVDGPRAVAHAALQVAPELALDRLAGVEQRLGPRSVSIRTHGVEEGRLIEHLADGSVS
jgi:hypothetical protein